MNQEIQRLLVARMEVTRIYSNFPLVMQKRLSLKADSILQEEIGRLEKELSNQVENEQ